MLVNTAEKLLNRSTVKLLETYYKGNVKVYKILVAINRYEEGAYSPLVVDNIIMTICRNNLFNKIYFDVLGSTSRRCFSMFASIPSIRPAAVFWMVSIDALSSFNSLELLHIPIYGKE